MKIMIQEIPTRRYYRTPGVWTGDIRKASDFRTSTAALETILKSNLNNVQLVSTRDFKRFQVFPLKRSPAALPQSPPLALRADAV
jgi:hypothetical protein